MSSPINLGNRITSPDFFASVSPFMLKMGIVLIHTCWKRNSQTVPSPSVNTVCLILPNDLILTSYICRPGSWLTITGLSTLKLLTRLSSVLPELHLLVTAMLPPALLHPVLVHPLVLFSVPLRLLDRFLKLLQRPSILLPRGSKRQSLRILMETFLVWGVELYHGVYSYYYFTNHLI
jgi:hypothetical protein